MEHALSDRQRALIEQTLLNRLKQLSEQVRTHQDGETRVEHARTVLTRDAGEFESGDADREVDLALIDLNAAEAIEINAALRRLQQGRYGRCAECGEPIAFERLRENPQALRCLDCQVAHERASGAGAAPTM